MGTISLSLPVSATVVTAGLHSTNYTTIQNVVNGNLDNNNISSTAGIDGTKLANNVARVYDRVTTSPNPDVQNDATEKSVYTKSISGNDMGTNRMLRLTLLGDFLHNNVAGDTMTMRIKFGGTTFWANASNLGNAIGAARHPWHLYLHIANLGATNSQMILGQVAIVESASSPAPTTGIGVGTANTATGLFGADVGISTLGTIDTTTAQTLDVTVQWSAANANNSWRTRYAVLELV